MQSRTCSVFYFFLLSLIGGLLLPHTASAWWNDQWSERAKLTLDTSAAGAAITEPMGASPVLVRLHVGNFAFDKAQQDGSDLRFIASDDETPLKFHLEKYDSLLGEGYAWVNVPDLKPGMRTEIFLYYGNADAPVAADARGTYDSDTLLVYHFAERDAQVRDYSGQDNHAQLVGSPADGSLIAAGMRLDAQTAVTLPASASLTWSRGAPLTWSMWIRMVDVQRNAVIFSRSNGNDVFTIGVDSGAPFVEVAEAGSFQRSAAATALSPGGWHHLAVIADAQGITLFLDGEVYSKLAAALPALSSVATLGTAAVETAASSPATGVASTAASYTVFSGELDELQISKIARPAGFIKAAAIGQGGEQASKFLTFSAGEQTTSASSGYFAVILRSVTLDGWVVIAVLAVMAVISWVVMAEKTAHMNRLEKANVRFLGSFRQLAADLTILDRGEPGQVSSLGGRISAADQKMLQHSSLYRIYHTGAEEIRSRLTLSSAAGNGNGGGISVAANAHGQAHDKILDAPSIEAIRASLDARLVRETQHLNRLMVILTIAISGGPFLGLLGTVVGVMITFAAIAASGDVNVNAIAPGIAAALVATVAGLVVAIPALFGYNYLIPRIKDATSDMQVFVDEFVTKMAESYYSRGKTGGDATALIAQLVEQLGALAYGRSERPVARPV